MAQVPLTQAQISAALNRSGAKLGAGQFTFSIPGASSIWPTYAAGTEPFTSYSVVTAAQAAQFRAALATWDELIAPSFTQVADDASGRGEVRVAFTSYNMTSGTAAYAYSGSPQPAGGKVGDVWISSVYTDSAFARGTYNYQLMIHELGHTMGLSHPFGDPALPAPYENTRYTVMSYTEAAASLVVSFRASGSTIRSSSSYAVAVTPMVLDIAAVQTLYGADPATRAGDTVYTFNQDDTFLQSIYDASGSDTIDLSNFTRPNIVDLTPGSYSSLGVFDLEAQVAYWTAQFPGFGGFIRQTLSNADLFTRADNLGIALSTVIENATGGAAADTIAGNDAANILRGLGGADRLSGGAGADTLEGGSGDDVLTGGAGADVFRFATIAEGADRITDFAPAEDRFDLSGGAFTALAEANGATTLQHGGGSVTVDGVVGLTLAQWNVLAGIVPTPAPAPTPTPTPAPTPTAAAVPTTDQFILVAGAGVQATVVGSGAVAAGAPGVQDITVRDGPGTISFGASFNTGGDRVHLNGAAAAWTVARSGSSAVLSDGDTAVRLPAGAAGIDVIFDDGIRTLRVDEAAGVIRLGAQALTTTAAAVTSAAGTATATAATDPGLAAQMLLTGAGPVTAIGKLQIAGLAAAETVVVTPGSSVVFGASFNAGGDTVVLAGAAASYTAYRSGSTVVLTSATDSVQLPGGTVGLTLNFAGGDARVLIVDVAAGAIRIGAQAIGTTPAPLSAAAAGFADVAEAAFGVDAPHAGLAHGGDLAAAGDHLALVA